MTNFHLPGRQFRCKKLSQESQNQNNFSGVKAWWGGGGGGDGMKFLFACKPGYHGYILLWKEEYNWTLRPSGTYRYAVSAQSVILCCVMGIGSFSGLLTVPLSPSTFVPSTVFCFSVLLVCVVFIVDLSSWLKLEWKLWAVVCVCVCVRVRSICVLVWRGLLLKIMNCERSGT